jgi:hypothetical protein
MERQAAMRAACQRAPVGWFPNRQQAAIFAFAFDAGAGWCADLVREGLEEIAGCSLDSAKVVTLARATQAALPASSQDAPTDDERVAQAARAYVERQADRLGYARWDDLSESEREQEMDPIRAAFAALPASSPTPDDPGRIGRRDFNAECPERPGVSVGEDLVDKWAALGATIDRLEHERDQARAAASPTPEKIDLIKALEDVRVFLRRIEGSNSDPRMTARSAIATIDDALAAALAAASPTSENIERERDAAIAEVARLRSALSDPPPELIRAMWEDGYELLDKDGRKPLTWGERAAAVLRKASIALVAAAARNPEGGEAP